MKDFILIIVLMFLLTHLVISIGEAYSRSNDEIKQFERMIEMCAPHNGLYSFHAGNDIPLTCNNGMTFTWGQIDET